MKLGLQVRRLHHRAFVVSRSAVRRNGVAGRENSDGDCGAQADGDAPKAFNTEMFHFVPHTANQGRHCRALTGVCAMKWP